MNNKQRIIVQDSIDESDIDLALSILKKRVMEKIGNKKKYPFVSPKEAFGKLTEEFQEVLFSLHKEDWDEFESEILDCAYVCVRYISGKYKTEIIDGEKCDIKNKFF